MGRVTPRRSCFALAGSGLAIAGLVSGYVGIALSLLVLPMLLAIAIPNFTAARAIALRNACINNLRMIDNAKQQWALENKKEDTDTPTEADLVQFMKSGQSPVCPARGIYAIRPVAEEPTCSVPNHALTTP